MTRAAAVVATRFGPFEYFSLILMAMVLIASVSHQVPIQIMSASVARPANVNTTARPASVAYPLPQCSRAIVQPISGSGQPSGYQGPTRPSHSPVSRCSTEKKP